MNARQAESRISGSQAGQYEIILEGSLDACWGDWFDGMAMQVDPVSQTTRLAGSLPDQAALHGVLARVRDLGLTLLSVRRLPPSSLEDEVSFRILLDSGEALDAFIALLEQAGEWLWKKGITQWRRGVHDENRNLLKQQVEHGCLVLAYLDDLLAGGCILTEIPPAVWDDLSGDAFYLSSLVVARFAAGRGLGKQIIERSLQVAREQGKSSLRLDCWDGNEFLKTYYREMGFTMLGVARLAGYDCRLFEMDAV